MPAPQAKIGVTVPKHNSPIMPGITFPFFDPKKATTKRFLIWPLENEGF
jgi:hypothetical protein